MVVQNVSDSFKHLTQSRSFAYLIIFNHKESSMVRIPASYKMEIDKLQIVVQKSIFESLLADLWTQRGSTQDVQKI
jgi:hypothetical protein